MSPGHYYKLKLLMPAEFETRFNSYDSLSTQSQVGSPLTHLYPTFHSRMSCLCIRKMSTRAQTSCWREDADWRFRWCGDHPGHVILLAIAFVTKVRMVEVHNYLINFSASSSGAIAGFPSLGNAAMLQVAVGGGA